MRHPRPRPPAASILALALGLALAAPARGQATKEVKAQGRGPAPAARPAAPGTMKVQAPAPANALFPAPAPAAANARPGAPLASKIPGTGLLFYAQSDGLDAHAAEWKASAASKALNETTLGALLEDLARQGFDLMGRGARGPRPSGAELVALIERAVRTGVAVGVGGNPESLKVTVAIRGGARPDLLEQILKVVNEVPRAEKPRQETRGGRKVTFAGPNNATPLIEDAGDLVICGSAEVDATLALLDGKAPSVAALPLVAELGRAEADFRPVVFGFFDPKGLGELPADAKKLGVDGVERVDFRWGFRGEALYSVFRIKAPAPRRGVMAMLDGPTFDRSTLPAMPDGVTGFVAGSIAPSTLFEKLAAILQTSGRPNDQQAIARAEGAFRQLTGADLKATLGQLGPKMAAYSMPTAEPGGLPVAIALVAEVRQPDALAATLGKAFDVVNQALKQPRPGRPADAPTPEVRKLSAQLGFRLDLPEGTVPPGPAATLKPTLLIGKTHMVLATLPVAAEAALKAAEGRGPAWKPAGAHLAAMDALPKGMIGLSVSDPREILPPLVENLPMILAAANQQIPQRPPGPNVAPGPAIPIEIDPAKIPPADQVAARLFPATTAVVVDAEGIQLIGRESLPNVASPGVAGVMTALLLPAVQAAREAARRAQCVNNLKQIGLAMHNFHSANNTFPAAAIADKDGKPLLSWRVAILPYIEQGELYNKFKLDEPWDSDNNKPLIAEMPKVFLCPDRKDPEKGTTCYCGFSGVGAMYEPGTVPMLQGITDGTSNTLMTVESDTPVIWSKPDDIAFDPNSKAPTFGAGSNHPGGWNALFMDGSVRFLKKTINRDILKALISPRGGEVINADAF